MNFNRHSNIEGKHAFLGASKYHWINYDEEKFCIDVSTDDERGMHEFIVSLHHDEEDESEEEVVEDENQEEEEQIPSFKSFKFGAQLAA